jgi:hypothetical protein
VLRFETLSVSVEGGISLNRPAGRCDPRRSPALVDAFTVG